MNAILGDVRNNRMSDTVLVLVVRNEHWSVKMTLWFVKELEEYLESRIDSVRD